MMTNDLTSTHQPRVAKTLQLDHEVYVKIEALAKKMHRSFNWIAVRILRQVFEEDGLAEKLVEQAMCDE
jgi:predicted transcriptional regulator